MKGVDFSCTSPASIAICSSIGHRSMVRRGRRPIDRHGPKPYAPCLSQLPIIPKPHNNHEKSRKSSAKQSDSRRKSSTDITDLSSPPGSSRYLLSDKPFNDGIPESNHASTALVPTQSAKPRHVTSNDSPALKSSSARSRDQVVVLRVSIHCMGCERKVRKHISKMEGVTSFSIDLETKKVTIIGDVTPLGVLASVSRVKSAQFWPSSSTTTTTTSSPVVKHEFLTN